MPRKHAPELYVGWSGRVFCATRFTARKDGLRVAAEKFDVTENFDALVKERAKAIRRAMKTEATRA